MSIDINVLLDEAVKRGASDLHITVGLPPMLRLHGELVPLVTQIKKEGQSAASGASLRPVDTSMLSGQIMNDVEMERYADNGEIDLSYSIPSGARFRVNIYRQKGNTAVALRVITEEIPDIIKLGLPNEVIQMTHFHKGFILVTGPTGSGKTTTLASLLDMINRERRCHILTLEDPIEYLHKPKRCMINQREIGRDSMSFANGLRAALRQDPDVILVGEMRDLETINIALTAAETGHLVFATLHTVDAPQTIDRIIDVFPPHQQQQIRVQLSNVLIGVVAQKLLKKKGGQGRVVATEILMANTAIRNLIREGKIHQIYSAMQTGGKDGMHLMDSSLRKLFEKGSIDYETALEHSFDQESMAKSLGRNIEQKPAGSKFVLGRT